MPNGPATLLSNSRTHFPGSKPTATNLTAKDTNINREWTRIDANRGKRRTADGPRFTQMKWIAPFKSAEFDQRSALDFAFAHAISARMSPPTSL